MHFRTTPRAVRAVERPRVRRRRGRDVAIVGESGLRQEHRGAGLPAPHRRSAGEDRCGRMLLGGRDILRARATRELRKVRGRQIAMIFQDPMMALNPVFTIGRQIGEVLRLHLGLGAREAARAARVELLDLVRRARARGARTPVPAQPLRRHAPARDDRDGARLPAEAADRRRADHGARRDRPGAGARADPALKERFGMAVLLITHDLGVVAETARSRGGDVRRPQGRGGQRPDDLRGARAIPIRSGLLEAAQLGRGATRCCPRSPAPCPRPSPCRAAAASRRAARTRSRAAATSAPAARELDGRGARSRASSRTESANERRAPAPACSRRIDLVKHYPVARLLRPGARRARAGRRRRSRCARRDARRGGRIGLRQVDARALPDAPRGADRGRDPARGRDITRPARASRCASCAAPSRSSSRIPTRASIRAGRSARPSAIPSACTTARPRGAAAREVAELLVGRARRGVHGPPCRTSSRAASASASRSPARSRSSPR